MLGDGPADDDAAEGVEDDGQIDLALVGRVFGHVHDPQLVGTCRVERAVDEIVGGFGGRVRPGAAPPPPAVDADHLGLVHEPLHPLPEHRIPSPRSSAWTRGEP